MKVVWQFDPGDIDRVQAFFRDNRHNPFVKSRVSKNLAKNKSKIRKDLFWACMVGCLLSTQQRSGPDSPVARFQKIKPFPLKHSVCARQKNLAVYARRVIAKFGGLRRSITIGKELTANMNFLRSGGWTSTLQQLEQVRLHSSPETEKCAAEFINYKFKGFGPKQSRNLLQGLGLSRYEISIDSRITKWLNAYGFPVKLTANALQDSNYYNFISDGFQELCGACDVFPCVLDAAIFSSFDKGQWTEENLVW